MSIFLSCSFSTLIKGYNYYKENKIIELKKEGNKYIGVVKGTEEYNVICDLNNILNSKCSCKVRGFCKHIAAIYFATHENERYEFEKIIQDIKDEQKEKEIEKNKIYEEIYSKTVSYVEGLSNKEIKDELIRFILDRDYYNVYENDYYDEDDDYFDFDDE